MKSTHRNTHHSQEVTESYPSEVAPPPTTAKQRHDAEHREESTTLAAESDTTTSQRSGADPTVELMMKAFRAGVTRIVFLYGPQPPINPREAVIYVDNYAEFGMDAADEKVNSQV